MKAYSASFLFNVKSLLNYIFLIVTIKTLIPSQNLVAPQGLLRHSCLGMGIFPWLPQIFPRPVSLKLLWENDPVISGN